MSEAVHLSRAVRLVFSGANADGYDTSIVARLTGEALPVTLVAVVVKVNPFCNFWVAPRFNTN